MTKAWITKYALTEGIFSVDTEIIDGDKAISYVLHGSRSFSHGNDWHTNKNIANKRAEVMRVTKIASLKKQIIKLEKMTFDIPD